MKLEMKRSECGVRKPATTGWPELWRDVPAGERTLICAIARMLRSAKQSQLREVARAAEKWELGIGCFIKVRLMHEVGRRPGTRRGMVDSGWVRIEGKAKS